MNNAARITLKAGAGRRRRALHLGLALTVWLAGAAAQGAETPAALTPELTTRILQNLKVVAVPKGQAGASVKLLSDSQGQPAKTPADAIVRWDDQGLTVAFECADDQLQAGAPPRGRDDPAIGLDDTVEVFLDIGARRNPGDFRWRHVAVTPAGAILDECGPVNYDSKSLPTNADLTWNPPGLKAKAEKASTGWRAEIFLPWDDLGGQPEPGESWGFNLYRANRPGTNNLSLFPTFGSPYHSDGWGRLLFAEQPVDGRILGNLFRDLRVTVATRGAAGRITGSFVGLQGEPIAKEGTTAAARWDDCGLTLAVDCEDQDVWAVPVKRDDMDTLWTSNDTVEVFLETGNQRDPNTTRWLHLIVGASGSAADQRGPMVWNPPILTREGHQPPTPKSGDMAWDLPDLKVKAEKTPAGWRVEIFLPWQGVGGQPAAGDVWGFNLARNNWTKGAPEVMVQCLAPTLTYLLTLARWGNLLFLDQPLDLPPPPARAALPPPGKDAPKAGANLVFNGQFDQEARGWQALCIHASEIIPYCRNEAGWVKNIAGVYYCRFGDYLGVDRSGWARTNSTPWKHMFCLTPPRSWLRSRPFPLDPGCRYRLEAVLHNIKGNARVFVDGYRWKPGVKPHAGLPLPAEMELVWRSPPLVYKHALAWSLRDQDLAHPPPGVFAQSRVAFPDLELPPADRRAWQQVQFGRVSIESAVFGYGSSGHIAVAAVAVERSE